MKIRVGFVTNSSSSSFLIVLPHRPKNFEELKRMVFGNERAVDLETLKALYQVMPKQTITFDKLLEFFKEKDYWFEDHEDRDFKDYDWDEIHRYDEEKALQKALEYVMDYAGHYMFAFEWSDHDQREWELQQHQVLRVFPHEIANHH